MAVICFFVIGILIGCLDYQFRFSSATRFGLGCYILMAIGLQGGVALMQTTDITQAIAAIGVALVIVIIMPLYIYPITKKMFGKITGGAVAASYACYSPTTYAVALHFLQEHHVEAKGYMAAAMALGEPLGIAVILMILGKKIIKSDHENLPTFLMPFTIGPCLLLILSLVVGLVIGNNPMTVKSVEPFYKSLFMGGLCVFVLAEGLEVSTKIKGLFKKGIGLFIFAILIPIIGAAIGLLVSYWMHLPTSTAFLLTILCASANYTTVPATFTIKLPEADIGIYESMPLCLTFTFNVVIGMGVYWYLIHLWNL
jgi:hypothetical protein